MCINCGSAGCGGCQPQIPTSPAGAAGKNAFTKTTASFTMPAVSANVTITVSSTGQYNNAWAKALQVVAITGAGYFQVVSTAGLNQITVMNLGYAGNATPADTIASGATVAPAGLQGLQGADGDAGVNGTSTLFAFTNTVQSATTGSPVTLRNITIAFDTLANDGDSIVISAFFNHTVQTNAFTDSVKVTFGGQDVAVGLGGVLPIQQVGAGRMIVRITRIDSTHVRCFTEITPLLNSTGIYSEFVDLTEDVTVPVAIRFAITQAAANTVQSTGFFIDKYVKQ